jgi:hypothetical protein
VSGLTLAHLFNPWTETLGIEELGNSEAFTANFTAARALLRPGRGHENSARMFSPSWEVKEPNAEVRAEYLRVR